VSALSIGQQQLVEIARLLARNARLLILDEPTATLTDNEISRIIDVLKNTQGARTRDPLYQPSSGRGVRSLRHRHGLAQRRACRHQAGAATSRVIN
jgi:ABC-type microcin C transport system duplicated ATPase subunit YejF